MSYRHGEEQPPDRWPRVTDQAVQRIDGLFEVNPAFMTEHVTQQVMPLWDIRRIVAGRHDHLEWMHRHWAATTISAASLLEEIDREARSEG